MKVLCGLGIWKKKSVKKDIFSSFYSIFAGNVKILRDSFIVFFPLALFFYPFPSLAQFFHLFYLNIALQIKLQCEISHVSRFCSE